MGEKVLDLLFSQYGVNVMLIAAALMVMGWLLYEASRARSQRTYELNRDLLAKRFDAYDTLWMTMKPLAIYNSARFDRDDVIKLSTALSEWYFSAHGGLFLTERARDLYFLLQDLLQDVSKLSDWTCRIRPVEPDAVFADMLKDSRYGAKISKADVKNPNRLGEKRKSLHTVLSQRFTELGPPPEVAGDRVFAALQQVSSFLRTALTEELRTRIDVQRGWGASFEAWWRRASQRTVE